MLTFLRKIRRSFIESGSSQKYLFYAIGEIALVVIGILIALQINNWNQNNKKEDLKQRLYVELRASIMSDTAFLSMRIEEYHDILEGVKRLKKVIEHNLEYTPDLDTALAKIQRLRSYEANYMIFERILDVGIEIIDDNHLKNEIQHFYEDSKSFTRFGRRASDLAKELYPRYFIRNRVGVEATPQDFEVLRELNEFKILMDYAEQGSENLIQRTVHRMNLAENILAMLNDQITISEDQLVKMPYLRQISTDSL